MFCPDCGRDIPDGARFCPYCGFQTKLDSSQQAEAPASAPTQAIPTQAIPTVSAPDRHQGDRERKVGRRRVAIIAGMCVLALVLVCALGASVVRRASSILIPSEHGVIFRAVSTELDESSSRIPAHITGTDVNGNDVDMELFLARDGVDCELMPGTYHLKVLGSPITSDGFIFDLTVSEIDFEVPKNLKPDEEYLVPSTKTLFFTPLDPAEVTDEQIEDAVAWARKDTDPSVDADALEQAAKDLRDNPPVMLDTKTMPMI